VRGGRRRTAKTKRNRVSTGDSIEDDSFFNAAIKAVRSCALPSSAIFCRAWICSSIPNKRSAKPRMCLKDTMNALKLFQLRN
jgi:hypothetical protein